MFGPVELIVMEQFFGVVGGAEEPLFQVFADDRGLAAFTVAVFAVHLFTRQGGVAARTEIDRGHFLVSQVVLEELQEPPLRPAVIFGVRGGQLGVPVKAVAHRAELLAHALDVGIGPCFWMNLALDGGVLRRETKGVVPVGEEDVVTLHAFEAGARVGWGHGIPMTDVKVAGRVGKHGKRVVLGFVGVCLGVVDAVSFPAGLPLGLDLFGLVHRYCGWVDHFYSCFCCWVFWEPAIFYFHGQFILPYFFAC